MSFPTANAVFEGRVHGVVVQAKKNVELRISELPTLHGSNEPVVTLHYLKNSFRN